MMSTMKPILTALALFALPASAVADDWPNYLGPNWDGTTSGKEVPVGTYYFIIIPHSKAKPITGHVTIIR